MDPGSGSLHHQAKIVRKTLISSVFGGWGVNKLVVLPFFVGINLTWLKLSKNFLKIRILLKSL
jgi:hypothetical protein